MQLAGQMGHGVAWSDSTVSQGDLQQGRDRDRGQGLGQGQGIARTRTRTRCGAAWSLTHARQDRAVCSRASKEFLQ